MLSNQANPDNSWKARSTTMKATFSQSIQNKVITVMTESFGNRGNSIHSTSWDPGSTSKYFNFKQRIRAIVKKNPQNSNMFEEKKSEFWDKKSDVGAKRVLFVWIKLKYFNVFPGLHRGFLEFWEKSPLFPFFLLLFYSGPNPLL